MELTHLGPYELGRTIGKGGMGAVYEAVDTNTGERVAVKALNPHLAQTEGFRERFDAEIESLKTLRHEGIVRLFGYGEQDGVLFYSMELVTGTSLEDELKHGRRFSWREVADIAIQLCKALKHAHDHGVVHRDIKPANILIDADDRVKLADFGIARLFGSTQLTTAGGVLGTADYMSPEQADGRPVTDRCDQYSLGGVMYALLAGRTPFRAKSLPEMLQLQRFAEPEPVCRYARDAPEQMESVIGQLLSKDPQDRFPNMIVLARHLEAMVRALSRPAADDFALSEDSSQITPPEHHDRHLTNTRSEQEMASGITPVAASSAIVGPGEAHPHAPTLGAASESNGAVPVSPPAADAESQQAPAEPRDVATFTTVEEEVLRQRSTERVSWQSIAGQVLVIGLLLAGVVGLVAYMGAPSSADVLYEKIQQAVAAESGDDLRTIEDEVYEFLDRYAADPRAGEIEAIREQLDLDKFERKLLRGSIGSKDDQAPLPIEELYLAAVKLSEEDPARAVRMLESLLAFHKWATFGEDDASARQAICLQLARNKLDELQQEFARRAQAELPVIRERLQLARDLAPAQPADARAVAAAIVDLYDRQPWAAEEVAAARTLLAETQAKEPSEADHDDRKPDEAYRQ